jgi:hypothetical protein
MIPDCIGNGCMKLNFSKDFKHFLFIFKPFEEDKMVSNG